MDNADKEKLLAIKLADNEKKTRNRAIVQMRNYISAKSSSKKEAFDEEALIKLWKGLHYCMWMADKSLIQQELSERISKLIHCFNAHDKQVLLFVKVYFQTIIREWNGIDKWRIDKFMMMMRDMLRESLNYLNSKKWNKNLMKKFCKILIDSPLNINDEKCPDGVSYHIADIFLEELVKFGESIKPIRAVKMLQPFVKLMAISKKEQFVLHVSKRVFRQIIECSDVGIDPAEEKEMEELKAYGLQAGEEDQTAEYSIKFNYDLIADNLFKMGSKQCCLERNKKHIYDLVKKFRALNKNVYPIDDYNLPPLNDKKPKKRRYFKKK